MPRKKTIENPEQLDLDVKNVEEKEEKKKIVKRKTKKAEEKKTEEPAVLEDKTTEQPLDDKTKDKKDESSDKIKVNIRTEKKKVFIKPKKIKLREDLDKTENLDIGKLKLMPNDELLDMALETGVTDIQPDARKDEIILSISKYKTEKVGLLYVTGVLEILPEGYGFLRSIKTSYLQSSNDVYISPSQIKLFGLRTGDTVSSMDVP